MHENEYDCVTDLNTPGHPFTRGSIRTSELPYYPAQSQSVESPFVAGEYDVGFFSDSVDSFAETRSE